MWHLLSAEVSWRSTWGGQPLDLLSWWCYLSFWCMMLAHIHAFWWCLLLNVPMIFFWNKSPSLILNGIKCLLPKSMLNDLWLNESAFILVWLMASDFCCLTHHRTNHVEQLESKLVMAESSRHETTKKSPNH